MNLNFNIIKSYFTLRNNIIAGVLIISFLFYLFSLSKPLFSDPYSTIVFDKYGELLGAKIADDGQWRFPLNDTLIPEKFKICLIEFEDRHFYYHPGVNLFSIYRALLQNIKSGKIVSGGSTISMQVIRLSQKNKSRTILQKIKEIVLATRLELGYSKKEILHLFAAHAPFGGNVVGLSAASWKYYNRNPMELSWSEAALLAVLPNAPSLMHPGKHRQLLIAKRNRLLDKLFERAIIDSITCRLAKLEPIPEKPLPLEQPAPQLVSYFYKNNKGEQINTSIDYYLQQKVTKLVSIHHNELMYNHIENAAVLIVEIKTGNVLTYVGNTSDTLHSHANDVDMIRAPRSTGSILKPILFAAMLDDGKLLQNQLVQDIPLHLSGFIPENFSHTFSGAVPASEALIRSLNIPALGMLKQYDLARFHNLLRQIGMTTLKYPPDHYGLSLILGGAETTLWDLAGIYSSMSRVLATSFENNGKYSLSDWHRPILYSDYKNTNTKVLADSYNYLSAGSIWITFNILLELKRPDEESGWKSYEGTRKIAWKTGTSFGFRDAWAIGTTPEYLVAVWVGNADGEGRPGLTGVSAAAPLLFDVFNILPSTDWFNAPYDELVKVPICRQSGYRPSEYCTDLDSIWILNAGLKSTVCPYHTLIHMDNTGQYRVSDDCYNPGDMIHIPWFVLPPVMEWYYIKNNPSYRLLPTYKKGCVQNDTKQTMELVYPKETTKVYVPVNIDGTLSQVVFQAVHSNPKKLIYWHLDDQYLGSTIENHYMPCAPVKGKHHLILVDEDGTTLERDIEVVDKEE